MQLYPKKVNDFLNQYNMDPNTIEMESEFQNFVGEMRAGLTDNPGTLRMLCTFININDDIPVGDSVIVMDAGGTNFRVALVTFDTAANPKIEGLMTYPMPGTRGEISRKEFFQTIVSYLDPIIHRSNKIGFCFSFPTAITPDRDGLLLGFTKEVKVKDMNHVLIGAGLKKALKESGIIEEKSVILLNDTVATLLGGKSVGRGRVYDSYIGYILGTGTNTCYIENNSNIVKYPDVIDRPGSMIINLESGGYGRFVRGEFDRRYDQKTANPGEQQLEKMVSGVYIGGVILELLHQAASDGLFSMSCVERLNALQILTAQDLDDFCYYPYDSNNSLGRCVNDNAPNEDANIQTSEKSDCQTLYYLIDAVFERAARMSAVNLAAVLFQSGKGRNPCIPVMVTAEGTMFYKAKLFRGKLDYYIKNFINDSLGLYCEFNKVDNVTLLGTAIAGLCE